MGLIEGVSALGIVDRGSDLRRKMQFEQAPRSKGASCSAAPIAALAAAIGPAELTTRMTSPVAAPRLSGPAPGWRAT
ncbi:hypothetical protein ABZU76_07990 [Amycolatopsis sp. NPDC005232]|uniref:hypothetical protein n=1 Tax=Amycolatopsis sp. NPDC005232 TaxID=3157027 RepID=UPI0033BC6B9F